MTPTQLLQQCFNEVAVKEGYTDWQDLMMEFCFEPDMYEYVQKIQNEAALLICKKMCEKQREIDFKHARIKFVPKLGGNDEIYEQIHLLSGGVLVQCESILNAPLATEEL